MSQDVGKQWSVVYDQGHDFILATSQEISKFLEYVDPAMPRTVLDVGCGTGQLARELYHRGFDVVGVDASASAIHIAHSLTVVPHQKLTYAHFDIEHDDLSVLPHRPYGLITCKLVYAFIQNRPAFLQKVRRILAPNGTFVVMTPMLEDVPVEKCNIAVSKNELKMLSAKFAQLALYRERKLTYFIGRLRLGSKGER